MNRSLQTRPALRTVLDGEDSLWFSLRFTLAFHPVLARIGAYVDLARLSSHNDFRLPNNLVLGRECTVLSDGQTLNEPHVSRRALVITQRQRHPDIHRLSVSLVAPSSSTTRLGGANAAELLLDGAELQGGVPVRLGHAVVGVLRLIGPLAGPLAPEIEHDDRESDRHEPTNPSRALSLVRAPGVSDPLANLVGSSAEMAEIRRQIRLVSGTDLPVLILGESGVGKELVARAIHAASPRHQQPWVAVNAAAIPESLAASELFGSEKGAYTGATGRPGFFQQASASSLFLDEIAELPLPVQAQLLRALESGEVQRVGGAVTQADVRLIAATDGQVDDTRVMSQALFNRLRGFVINVPPLRQRPEDIGPQLVTMLGDALGPLLGMPQQAEAVAPETIAQWAAIFFDCLTQPWHGNSRELGFFAQRIALDDSQAAPLRARYDAHQGTTRGTCDDDTLYAVHCEHGFEVKATAQALGWSRATTYRRIQAHPNLRLAGDIGNDEIYAALSTTGDLAEAARQLGVSVDALRPRLRSLCAGFPQ